MFSNELYTSGDDFVTFCNNTTTRTVRMVPIPPATILHPLILLTVKETNKINYWLKPLAHKKQHLPFALLLIWQINHSYRCEGL